MIEKTLKKITAELERLAAKGVSLHRGLDLLEASTESIEEIMALNTLRESLEELGIFKKRKMAPTFGQSLDMGTQQAWA